MKKIIAICVVVGSVFFSCDKQDDLYTIGSNKGTPLSEIISFYKVAPVSLDADSASLCTITVKLNAEADLSNRNVTFISSGGMFTNQDTTRVVQANSEGYATVNLLSETAGTIRVKASVLTYTIDTVVKFVAALPDDILLSADKFTGDTSDSFEVTTRLFRNPGRGLVTDPVKVFYLVASLDTSLNLVYPEFSYSSGRAAKIEITNPYKISGRFNVSSKVVSAAGDTLARRIMLVIH
jgi:hypothetical protein